MHVFLVHIYTRKSFKNSPVFPQYFPNIVGIPLHLRLGKQIVIVYRDIGTGGQQGPASLAFHRSGQMGGGEA